MSSHYYYLTDHGWKFEGYIEAATHRYVRPQRGSDVGGIQGGRADWKEQYKPYVEDGQTVFVRR